MAAKQFAGSVHQTGSDPSGSGSKRTLLDRLRTFLCGEAHSLPDRLLFAGLLFSTFLVCCFPLADTDLWWHLRTGELIVERGEVPSMDWFTFTDGDRPWIDLHWGFQLLMTLLHRIGGTDLIVLFKAAVTTLMVAVAWRSTGRDVPTWLKSFLWLMPIIALSGRAYERPEMLSLLFLAMWLWIIERLPERPSLIWWLPLIQFVWVNCHSLFVLGLVVGACYVADRLLRMGAQGRFGLLAADTEPKGFACQIAGLSIVLVCFLNPYFEQGAIFPLEVYRKLSVDQEFYSTRIGEFQRPLAFVRKNGLTNVYVIAQLGIGLVAAASFLALARERRWNPYRLMLFAGFSNLALEASRNVNLFAVVSAAVTVANVQDWLHLRIKRVESKVRVRPASLKRATSSVSNPHASTTATWGMVLLYGTFSLTVVTNVWHRFAGEGKSFGLGERTAWFAHDAAKFAGQPGFPNRAFVSHIGQAAVFIYHHGPERRVFMDGRLEVCTRRTFEVYEAILFAMSAGDPSWQNVLRDADGSQPLVMLDSRYSRDAINGMLNTPGWTLVFADAAAAVFLEKKLARKLSLPPVDVTPLIAPPEMKPRK